MAEKLPSGEDIVSLVNLSEGQAVELFNLELQRVLNNIADVNSPAKARRSVTLKVTFVPDETRQVADVMIDCDSKIAGNRGVKTQVAMGMHHGKQIAVEGNINQGKLFEKEPLKPRAVKIGE